MEPTIEFKFLAAIRRATSWPDHHRGTAPDTIILLPLVQIPQVYSSMVCCTKRQGQRGQVQVS